MLCVAAGGRGSDLAAEKSKAGLDDLCAGDEAEEA